MNSNVKNITVVPAAGGPPQDLSIAPGTTARDILRQLGFDEPFILTNGRGAEPFGYDENVFPMIPDGAKLYASTPVEVGGFFKDLVRALNSLGASLPQQNASEVELAPGGAVTVHKSRCLRSPETIGGQTVSRGIVRREPLPYWKERGWSGRDRTYSGYYRTKVGAWKGRADVSPSGKAKLFIQNPPEFLKNHPHWGCFTWRDGGWYAIHTSGKAELSAGILRIEEILKEAFSMG